MGARLAKRGVAEVTETFLCDCTDDELSWKRPVLDIDLENKSRTMGLPEINYIKQCTE